MRAFLHRSRTKSVNRPIFAPMSNTQAPSGTVIFMDGTTGLASVGTNSQGVATYTTSTLAVGSHSIKAVYNGDGSFNQGNSNLVSETIFKANSSIESLTKIVVSNGIA